VHVLAGFRRTKHIESREVAAQRATPARVRSGRRQWHAVDPTDRPRRG
jgi:hypothetical protein